MAKKAHVKIDRDPDGHLSEVWFHIYSPDGEELTGQQILEAVGEALLIHWPHHDFKDFTMEDYDS